MERKLSVLLKCNICYQAVLPLLTSRVKFNEDCDITSTASPKLI